MGVPVSYADASTPRYTGGRHCGAIDQRQAGADPARLARGPGAGGEHDHKYIVIATDTTPVHALTIYQEEVKDNTPPTGNPFAGGIGAPMPTGRRWPRCHWTSSG
jgi:hypothetical protein